MDESSLSGRQLVGACALLAVACVSHWATEPAHRQPADPLAGLEVLSDAWAPVAPRPVVAVRGAVARPGVYPIDDGLRDVLARAGAPEPDRWPRVSLFPGAEVRVWKHTDGRPCAELGRMEAAEGLLHGLPVPVNEATAAELQVLPGAGPTLSERITADRARWGPFRTLDELVRVRGVGRVRVTRWRPLATASLRAPAPRTLLCRGDALP